MQTATQLFAKLTPAGTHRCFFCGGWADDVNPADETVKKSFTGLDTVTLSKWVCDGCIEAMGERSDIVLLSGECRSGQKVRGYSWIVTGESRRAATKSHRTELLNACASPPSVPFVICLTDSGKKHLLYRAVVNYSRDTVTVTLEGERITYKPSRLLARFELCRQVCAATGKPALKEPLCTRSQMRVYEHFESDIVLAAWLDCFSEPLTRLATWLCPPKEICSNVYPGITSTD